MKTDKSPFNHKTDKDGNVNLEYKSDTPQPNEPDKAINDFKAYFEANLLDGDDIHTESKGTMLSAQEVYSVMQGYLTQQSQAAIDAYKSGLISKLPEYQKGYMPFSRGFNEAITTVKAIITEEL